MSYSIELPGEQPLRTKRGDKAGRGAEYSALEVFADRLITMDDRTGNVDEIVPGNGFLFGLQVASSSRASAMPLSSASGRGLSCGSLGVS